MSHLPSLPSLVRTKKRKANVITNILSGLNDREIYIYHGLERTRPISGQPSLITQLKTRPQSLLLDTGQAVSEEEQ